ncbi:hypothetical protein ABK040_001398 [Willaertia magna]
MKFIILLSLLLFTFLLTVNLSLTHSLLFNNDLFNEPEEELLNYLKQQQQVNHADYNADNSVYNNKLSFLEEQLLLSMIKKYISNQLNEEPNWNATSTGTTTTSVNKKNIVNNNIPFPKYKEICKELNCQQPDNDNNNNQAFKLTEEELIMNENAWKVILQFISEISKDSMKQLTNKNWEEIPEEQTDKHLSNLLQSTLPYVKIAVRNYINSYNTNHYKNDQILTDNNKPSPQQAVNNNNNNNKMNQEKYIIKTILPFMKNGFKYYVNKNWIHLNESDKKELQSIWKVIKEKEKKNHPIVKRYLERINVGNAAANNNQQQGDLNVNNKLLQKIMKLIKYQKEQLQPQPQPQPIEPVVEPAVVEKKEPQNIVKKNNNNNKIHIVNDNNTVKSEKEQQFKEMPEKMKEVKRMTNLLKIQRQLDELEEMIKLYYNHKKRMIKERQLQQQQEADEAMVDEIIQNVFRRRM